MSRLPAHPGAFPADRIAGTEIARAGSAQRADGERATVCRNGQDVGERAAERERFGRIAERVDERVVPRPTLADLARG